MNEAVFTLVGSVMSVRRFVAAGGFPILSFVVAANRPTEEALRPFYVDVQVLGGAVEGVAERLEVGEPVFVSGVMRQGTFERDGVKVSRLTLLARHVERLAGEFETLRDKRGAERLAAGLNEVRLMGRAVAVPEVKVTTAGTTLARFSVAVNSSAKSSRPTSFFSVIAWEDLVPQVAGLQRGSPVVVTGSVIDRVWSSEDGARHSAQRIEADWVLPLQRVRTAQPAERRQG